MVIDKPEHQAFLLELLNAAQYPGHVLDLAYEVKQAIKGAAFADTPAKPETRDGATESPA